MPQCGARGQNLVLYENRALTGGICASQNNFLLIICISLPDLELHYPR